MGCSSIRGCREFLHIRFCHGIALWFRCLLLFVRAKAHPQPFLHLLRVEVFTDEDDLIEPVAVSFIPGFRNFRVFPFCALLLVPRKRGEPVGNLCHRGVPPGLLKELDVHIIVGNPEIALGADNLPRIVVFQKFREFRLIEGTLVLEKE